MEIPWFQSILRRVTVFVTTVWYFIIPKIFSLTNFCRLKKVVPPVKDEILLNSAIELAKQIRAGEVTSEELVEACIRRINEINKQINAVVETNFASALEEARRVDQMLSTGSAPPQDACPLLGVPFTAKDGIPINGMLCTAGIPARRNMRVLEDAHCVALLKKAGAIPLAVTNVSEVAMWWEAYNGIYGRSNNPYDSRRSAGGSSGGEAALQAAAGSVLSIGGDIGGIVPVTGTVPSVRGFRSSMLSLGPMCRYAEDMLPLLRVLAGPNVDQLHLDSPVDFKGLRIFYMNGLNSIATMKPEAEMTDAMHRAMKYFEMRYNTLCYRLDLSLVHWAFPIWSEAMYDAESPTFSQEMCNRTGDLNPYVELMKWVLGQSEHTLPALGLAIVERITRLCSNEERHRLLEHLRQKLRDQLEKLLADNGVLFFPSHPTAAPFHYQPLLTPTNAAYTALFNALTLPVTQCPMGVNSSGLPIGLQIVAASCQDRLTIAVAQELEKAFGGWMPPGSR